MTLFTVRVRCLIARRWAHAVATIDTSSYAITDVLKGVACLGVFWVDRTTVGCLDLNKNTFVKFSAPRPR